MPMTFPAHQGLILPVVRRWPHSFDALALSIGAAMPDLTDTILGFSINGYFKQWYGHSLIGIFTLDLMGGLCLTWSLAGLARPLKTFVSKAPSVRAAEDASSRPIVRQRNRLRLWSFSVLVGILSHVGFDLISHDTNLLFYPWYENVRWFPKRWYTIWFEIPALHAFGRRYSFGVFSIIWGTLTILGTFLFIRFLGQEYKNRNKAE